MWELCGVREEKGEWPDGIEPGGDGRRVHVWVEGGEEDDGAHQEGTTSDEVVETVPDFPLVASVDCGFGDHQLILYQCIDDWLLWKIWIIGYYL